MNKRLWLIFQINAYFSLVLCQHVYGLPDSHAQAQTKAKVNCTQSGCTLLKHKHKTNTNECLTMGTN